jgi:hemerythrin-like domain-containing protein
LTLLSTDELRNDHKTVKKLRDIVNQCSSQIYSGKKIPVEDIRDILVVVEEFVGNCHHGKEECSYFPKTCEVDSSNVKETDALKIEHELGRRIGKFIERSLSEYLADNRTEPVARFLKAYRDFLDSHLSREEKFFENIDKTIDSEKFDDKHIVEQFEKIEEERIGHGRHEELQNIVLRLEQCEWMKQ